MEDHLPIVIVGAGCAGLSQAVHLLEAGVTRPIHLIDGRLCFDRDRTWCGFSTRPHPFDACTTHTWDAWRVSDTEATATAKPKRYRYAHIPADRFYENALCRLRDAVNVKLTLGTQVDQVIDAGTHAVVVLADGRRFNAGLVLDSRPLGMDAFLGEKFDVCLFQQFVGLHVRAASDVFEPGHVEMMDFRVEQAGAIRFVYVLPYSPTEALIEATAFYERPRSFDDLENVALQYALARHGLERPSVLHRERGLIPMSTATIETRPATRVIRIGLAGAAAKPSTGYAFGHIQAASAALARDIALGLPAVALTAPKHRRATSTFLDRVFLCYLRRHPERAPALFTRIFARCNADAVARFLTDAGGVTDDLRMISAMPKWPFIMEACRSWRTWTRWPALLNNLRHPAASTSPEPEPATR